MLSTRCLVILALVATASTLPTQEESNSITTYNETELGNFTSSSEEFDEDFWLKFSTLLDLLEPLWRLLMSFEDLGAELLKDELQVIVQVEGYRTADLKVTVKGDAICVEGLKEIKQEGQNVYFDQFIHTYVLPANASANDVTANVTSDGFLIITAPIKGLVNGTQDTFREVPIVETGTPYHQDEGEELTTLKLPSVFETAETNKIGGMEWGSTTPSEWEELKSEKDNEIPHGI